MAFPVLILVVPLPLLFMVFLYYSNRCLLFRDPLLLYQILYYYFQIVTSQELEHCFEVSNGEVYHDQDSKLRFHRIRICHHSFLLCYPRIFYLGPELHLRSSFDVKHLRKVRRRHSRPFELLTWVVVTQRSSTHRRYQSRLKELASSSALIFNAP